MHRLELKLCFLKSNLRSKLILLSFLVASCGALSSLALLGGTKSPLPFTPIAPVPLLAASCAGAALLGLPGVANLLFVAPLILPTTSPPPSPEAMAVLVPFDSILRTIAITRDGSKLYAADGPNNTVSVIDTSKNQIIATVNVGGPNPSNLAITPDGSKVFVANSGSDSAPGNTVSIIETSTNEVSTISVGFGPSGIAITPDSSKVYVANSIGTVSVIDTSTDNEVKRIPVGFEPGGMAITPTGCAVSKAYVTNFGDGTVSVIDVQNDTVIGDPIRVGLGPRGITLTPDCSKVYVANSFSNTVSVINTSTNKVTTIPVGSNPVVAIIAPDGSKVYLANSGSNTVSVIDIEKSVTDPTNAVIDTLDVGSNPIGIAITGNSSKFYVANSGTDSAPGNTVSAIEVKTKDGKLSFNITPIIQMPKTVKASPVAITIKPDSSRVYVANVDTISVIDVSTDKVTNTIPVNPRPSN